MFTAITLQKMGLSGLTFGEQFINNILLTSINYILKLSESYTVMCKLFMRNAGESGCVLLTDSPCNLELLMN